MHTVSLFVLAFALGFVTCNVADSIRNDLQHKYYQIGIWLVILLMAINEAVRHLGQQ